MPKGCNLYIITLAKCPHIHTHTTSYKSWNYKLSYKSYNYNILGWLPQ